MVPYCVVETQLTECLFFLGLFFFKFLWQRLLYQERRFSFFPLAFHYIYFVVVENVHFLV